jgi:hypothetical protein
MKDFDPPEPWQREGNMGFFQTARPKRAGFSAIAGLPLILLAASALAQAQPTASRVLVVYQTNAPDKDTDGVADSRQLAEYYRQKRGVPLSNLLGVTPTPAGGYYYQTSEYGKFQSEIVAPIKAKLAALGPTSIDVILLAGALPTAVADIDGTYTSIDNFLMGLNFYSVTTDNISWQVNPYGVDSVAGAPSISPDAPHFNHNVHTFKGTTMYLVCRLGSADSLAGLEQLDQSLYAEHFLSTNPGYYNGIAYVDSYAGQTGTSAKFTDAWLSSVIAATPSDYTSFSAADIWIAYVEHFVTAAGLPLKWENTVDLRSIGDPGATYSDGTPATAAPRALFYGGWYNFDQYNDVWEWLPGSVLCDLDSYSYYFASQAFARGASNASYVMSEPFLEGHPRPSVLYYYILKGYSFAEASALATPSIGWQAVNEGDPLYAPMAPHVAVLDTHAPVLSAGYPAVTLRSGTDWIVRSVISDSAEPEVARAKVDYGLTSAYGSNATSGQGYWRRPQVVLPGLLANTVYHYRLTLTDPVGNVTTTGDLTFTTGATGSGGGGGAPSLIGYWAFDENSGVTAQDTSGGGHNGVVNAANWTLGRVNSALNFNGSSSSVITSAIPLGSSFSVSAWVNPAVTTQAGYARIVETQYDGGLYLGMDGSGSKYKFIVNTGAGARGACGAAFGCAEGGSVTAGWHLVTATYDGTTGKLYVDGALAASETFMTPANTNFPLYIGRYYGSNGYGWQGGIDEVRLYNGALSASEVAVLFR